MELLSENLSIAPGEPFFVGWRIRRDVGWHTYWKHPGDVGVPPALKWEVPVGFTAGELCFPPPERIKMASVAAHGHKGEEGQPGAPIAKAPRICREPLGQAAQVVGILRSGA